MLPTCGVLAGPEQAFDTAMTVLYSWKALIAPSLKVANYGSYAEALGDLGTVLTTLQGVIANPGVVSSVGYPVAQANLLAGLMGGLPSKSRSFDGQTVNPAFSIRPPGSASQQRWPVGTRPPLPVRARRPPCSRTWAGPPPLASSGGSSSSSGSASRRASRRRSRPTSRTT